MAVWSAAMLVVWWDPTMESGTAARMDGGTAHYLVAEMVEKKAGWKGVYSAVERASLMVEQRATWMAARKVANLARPMEWMKVACSAAGMVQRKVDFSAGEMVGLMVSGLVARLVVPRAARTVVHVVAH